MRGREPSIGQPMDASVASQKCATMDKRGQHAVSIASEWLSLRKIAIANVSSFVLEKQACVRKRRQKAKIGKRAAAHNAQWLVGNNPTLLEVIVAELKPRRSWHV